MQLKLTFAEIENIVRTKTGKNLPLVYSGPHTIRINYEFKVLFRTSTVSLDITIDEIVGGDTVYVSHNGGVAIDIALSTALSRYNGQPGIDMLEKVSDCHYRVCLSKNEQISQVLERIELRDIHFDEQSVMIDFMPKGL